MSLRAPAALRWLVVALAVALCAALPGAAPVGVAKGAAAPAGVMPWETAGPFPAYYDLRDQGKVTPVRSQDSYSTCWIHSAMASLESCLLPGALFDFSENNMANHMGSRLDFEGRSDARLSTAYFARWDGPVLERDDPYPRKGRSPEGLLPVQHVQEVLYLPDRRTPLDNDALKWAVSTYGAVDTAMAFEGEYHNYGTFAYYSTTPGLELGHHATCVGWDDGFPAARFGEEPPGDGAFLIKNSWGADWGDAGYFWISYYDANYGQDMAVFNGAESVDDYDAIYQHDALGLVDQPRLWLRHRLVREPVHLCWQRHDQRRELLHAGARLLLRGARRRPRRRCRRRRVGGRRRRRARRLPHRAARDTCRGRERQRVRGRRQAHVAGLERAHPARGAGRARLAAGGPRPVLRQRRRRGPGRI